jgi:hypothetical protein
MPFVRTNELTSFAGSSQARPPLARDTARRRLR